jgi:hypothetical protein
MSFIKNWNCIPKSLISPYNPNYGRQLSMVRPAYDHQAVNNIMRNQKFNFHIPRGLEQLDLTIY